MCPSGARGTRASTCGCDPPTEVPTGYPQRGSRAAHLNPSPTTPGNRKIYLSSEPVTQPSTSSSDLLQKIYYAAQIQRIRRLSHPSPTSTGQALPHHHTTSAPTTPTSRPLAAPQRCCQRPHLVLRFFSATHCRAEGSIPFYLPFSLAPASVKIKFIHSFILQSDAHRLSPRGRALDFPTAPVRRVRFLNQRRLDKPSLSAVGQGILPTLASGALRLISC